MNLLSGGGKTGADQADEGLESYVEAGASAPASVPAPPAPKRAAADMFSGLRVSLMPSDLEGQAGPDLGKRLFILALVLAAETLAIGGAYFLLSQRAGSQLQKRQELRASIADLGVSIAKAETLAKEAVVWNAQAAAAEEALDDHLYWTSFFRRVESKTLPTVKYLNFSGDGDTGTITLDAVGATYRDVAEQIVNFRAEPMVADVRTTAASARVDHLGNVIGVSFVMVIKFKPDLWKQNPTETAAADAEAAQPQTISAAPPAEPAAAAEAPPAFAAAPPTHGAPVP